MVRILILVSAFILVTCESAQTDWKNLDKITISDQYGDEDQPDQINVDFNYYHFADTTNLTKTINTKIDSAIYSKMALNDSVINNYDDYYSSLKKEYLQLKEDFPDARSIGFQHTCKGEKPIIRNNVISVFIINYVYSGGAHGMEYHEFLNFDSKTGKLIDILSTIQNMEKFNTMAEQKLRDKRGMSKDDQWSDFTFIEQFQLPKNIGLTEKGYRLIYNPYEILSYADGHTEIFIGFDELK